MYKFQGLLHHSFDMNYNTTKLGLSKERDVYLKEQGMFIIVHCSKGYTPSGFKTINVVYSLCHSVHPLLQHSKSKQKAYQKIIHRLLTG